MEFLEGLPRFVLFTGKGGVGKTSLACASAVHLADQGKRVLLVSTDPASNVGQVFGVTIGNQVTHIAAVPGLDAIEIDPLQAAADYRERIIAPVRGLLPAQQIAEITEQLSGSCTTEIAAFNEFTAFLAGGRAESSVLPGPAKLSDELRTATTGTAVGGEDDSSSDRRVGEDGVSRLLADSDARPSYDHVIFDTAPTGHTIRLLQLPGDWTRFIDEGKGDASCLGPMAGLEKSRATYAAALAALGDPARTALVLVARPQASGLAEAARIATELAAIGIQATQLVVNAVLPASASTDESARALFAREQAALATIPAPVAGLPRDVVTLKPFDAVGLPALRGLLTADTAPASAGTIPPVDDPGWPGLDALVDELARADHGLVLCMGKGGVGKTTVATALAVALAGRGKDVHLTTTDPAGHVDDTLGARLRVSRIDPVQAVADYRAMVMDTKGRALDDDGRAALAEDLMSPCTEEIAVFEQFSRAVAESTERIVVMDTAPTGHTLLLLDATGSYHREVLRHAADRPQVTPLMRLQDPEQTKVIIVTIPEPTPVLEARQLQADLERAGIHPWAWVVNQSLAAAHPSSDLLRRRAQSEKPHLAQIARDTPRHVLIPLRGAETSSSVPLALWFRWESLPGRGGVGVQK